MRAVTRRPGRFVRRLLADPEVSVHVIEPGGAVFISGLDLEDAQLCERVAAALRGLSVDTLWVALPAGATVDTLSPAMLTAMLAEAALQDPAGGLAVARESSDQTILIRCPRCDTDVRMSLVTTMSVSRGRLTARALVDPTDVEVHDLRCNG